MAPTAKPETAEMHTQTEMQAQTEDSIVLPSSFYTPKKATSSPEERIVQVELEPKTSLLQHLRKLAASCDILSNLNSQLGRTEQYPDVSSLQDSEGKLFRITVCIRDLQTGGIMGDALVSLLPLPGRFRGVSVSSKLLAPLTIMAIAEAKLNPHYFPQEHKGSQLSCKYVTRLWRGTLDEGLDCCTTSSPKYLVALLDSIGAREKKPCQRKTKAVDYHFETALNIFTGQEHQVFSGIKAQVRPHKRTYG